MRPTLSLKILAACCCVLRAALYAESGTVFGKLGSEVVLKPDSVSGSITSITWKDGPNIAVEWENGDPEIYYYRQFKERGSLNISNGELTIRGLTRTDSGHYTPEINQKQLNTIQLAVISSVPVPTVNPSCDDKKTRCTLTCDGNTTGAEPVTYRWKSDNTEMISSKEQHVTKENNSSVKTFSCELENPVSNKSSQAIKNPLFNPPSDPEPPGWHRKIIGLTVFISLLTAVLMLVFIHRAKAGMWFFEKASMPWEGDFWRKDEGTARDVESNGNQARQKDELTDEEVPMKDTQRVQSPDL